MNPYYGGTLMLPVREFIPLSKVPLTIGFSLNSAFYEESEFFVSGAFGGALLFYPNFSYVESNEVHTTKDEIASKMCLKLKTGIVADETYTLSLNYFVLFGGHSNSLNNFEYNDTPTFSLTIGYNFN